MSLKSQSPSKYWSVPLTRGKFAWVDLDDLELVMKFKWHAVYSKGNWYAAARIDGQDIFMHNLLLGRRKGLEIDHENQDGLDNRRSNLRYSTPSQNRANVSLRKDNRSGFKGVCFYKPTNKWRAYIQVNKKWKQLGFFNSAVDAAVAYNKAALNAFGEFAWLNQIPSQ